MSLIPGKYQHYRNEDIDDYYSALGVPYFARKMIPLSSPTMEISMDKDIVTVKVQSKLWTSESKYVLGAEVEEKTPNASMMSKTSLLNDNEMETVSFSPNINLHHTRHYLFSSEECVMTLSHDKSNKKGKRYYKRVL